VETESCGGWSLRRSRANANDRQTRCGLHQDRWSDDACVATQLWLCHGLSRNLVVSWAELKLQDKTHLFAWRRGCRTVARACLRRCPEHQCMQVFTFHRYFWHHRTYLRHNHCRVCACARVCEVCSFALGDEVGGVQLVFAKHLSLGVGGYF